MKVFATIYDIKVGNTPSQLIETIENVEIWAKLEYTNPTGSIKYRPAFYIAKYLYERYEGRVSDIILTDASSGNFGKALSKVGRLFGFKKTVVYVPETANTRKIKDIWDNGGEVVMVPGYSTEEARKFAKEFAKSDPEHIVFTNQHGNLLNHQAHYETTGKEIWEQSKGRITVFINGLGTGGTTTGVGRYLKEQKPEVKVIGVVPDKQETGIDGLRHFADGLTDIYKTYGYVIDMLEEVNDMQAINLQTVLREKNYNVGLSSAANYHVAQNEAKKLNEGLIFILFADEEGGSI